MATAATAEVDAAHEQPDGRAVRPLAVVAAALLAALLLAGWAIRSAGDHGPAWDLRALQEMERGRTRGQDTLAGVAVWFANSWVVVPLTGLVALAAWRRWRGWVAPAFVLSAVAGEKLLYLIASIAVGRDRPPISTQGQAHATASFPSGHVGAAVTLYGAVAVLLWWAGRERRTVAVVLATVVAVAAPAAVAWSRMYQGWHYPTDVVAGALLGVIWLVTCVVALLRPARAVPRRRR